MGKLSDLEKVKKEYCLKIVAMVNTIIENASNGIPISTELATMNAEICMTLLEEVISCHEELAEIGESLAEMPFIMKKMKENGDGEMLTKEKLEKISKERNEDAHGKN